MQPICLAIYDELKKLPKENIKKAIDNYYKKEWTSIYRVFNYKCNFRH